jgi:SRSO17 transposase
LPEGKRNPTFRTKPQIALTLIERAQALGLPFRAVVADCFDGDDDGLVGALFERGIPYVLARRGRVGLGWAPAEEAHSFEDAAHDLPNSAWQTVTRCFTDGHTEAWRAAELTLFGYGPQQPERAIVATTDSRTLPSQSTWYLTTNLAGNRATLSDLVELYGRRLWVEESYKRLKDELGWADFMVRSDRAIRRPWLLACCTAGGARLVSSLAMALSVLAGMESGAPAPGIRSPAERRSLRPAPQSLPPAITNYR